MANELALVGPSGTGKSTSLRNLPPEETFIISPSKSALPIPGFRKKYSTISKENPTGNFMMTKDLSKACRRIKRIATEEKYKHFKYIVLDDVTHCFTSHILNPAFLSRNSGNEAFARWMEFGADVYNDMMEGREEWRNDLWIITSFHTETYTTPRGEKMKLKTPGGLLDKAVDIPSYFLNILYTHVVPVDKKKPQPLKDRYKFVTNDDGYYNAKTEFGAFSDDEIMIPNDVMQVIKRLEANANGELEQEVAEEE